MRSDEVRRGCKEKWIGDLPAIKAMRNNKQKKKEGVRVQRGSRGKEEKRKGDGW